MKRGKPIEPHEVGASWADAKAKGLRFYLGDQCKHGNVAPRYTNGGGCRCEPCRKDASRRSSAWAKENPERFAANQARADANPERQERRKGFQRDYNKRNAAKKVAAVMEWQRRNRERVAVHRKRWRLRHPDAVKAVTKRRNAAVIAAKPAWWSKWDVFVLQEAKDLAKRRTALTGITWEIDHMVPIHGRKASGLHCADNVQVIPRALNTWKRDRLVLIERGEWISHL